MTYFGNRLRDHNFFTIITHKRAHFFRGLSIYKNHSIYTSYYMSPLSYVMLLIFYSNVQSYISPLSSVIYM